ncbi:MAG: HD domain-containing protein [Bacteriovoracaceae bacterium]|nr:HD domain-containing protein [Bacteriovoracaceae bacterium]
MYNAHKILQSCGRAVPDEKLFDPSCTDKNTLYHKSVRLGALLHDIGTFCFSHTTEAAYISFGETTNVKGGKGLKDDHENLGSYIIKNTNYEGGLTHILSKHNIDPQTVSDLVKGTHSSYLANQILHSEIDCDRMDYLLRDAHYTGLKYGAYDRDYLLYHFEVMKVANHDILTIKNNAIHCVEDFLNSRFAWYSQVIRSPRGAKYDAIAERICFHFLEKGWIYKYSDLLEMINDNPMKFLGFNDNYFINTVHHRYSSGDLDAHPAIKEMAHTLLLERGARTIRAPELTQTLMNQDDEKTNEKLYKKAEGKIEEIETFLKKNGSDSDWIISDLPKKPIIFVQSKEQIIKKKTCENVLLERDPVKISYDNGDIKLLAEVESSVISRLQNLNNFIPNVFVSKTAYDRLLKAGIVEDAL